MDLRCVPPHHMDSLESLDDNFEGSSENEEGLPLVIHTPHCFTKGDHNHQGPLQGDTAPNMYTNSNFKSPPGKDDCSIMSSFQKRCRSAIASAQ